MNPQELGAYKGQTIYAGDDINAIIKQADSQTPKQQGISTIDAGKVGTTQPLDIPTQKNNSKTDRAMASIQTAAPTQEETKIPSIDDFYGSVLKNLPEEQRQMFSQFASQDLYGGVMGKAYEEITGKALEAQVNQSKRKKEEARLQEQAGLPELFAEQALIGSNYDNSEAARNSRLLNEAGGKTTISKSALSNRQSEIQRQYGLQVADNRINELVVAGKINSANVMIERKLDLKYADLEAEIDLYKSQLEMIKPIVDAENSKILQQREFALTQMTNEINSARDSEKQLELTKATALKNAMDRGASPMQIAAIQDAQSIGDIASTGFVTTLEERLRNQLLGSQITTEGLQQQQIKANTAKTLAESTPQTGQTQAQVSLVNDIRNVKNDPVFDSTFGLKGSLYRYLPNTPQYTLNSKINNIINQTALAARGELKGQGAVSDFEGKMLKEAQTELKINMAPADAKAALTKLEGAITTSSGGTAQVQITSSDGQSKTGVANQQMINDAINSGYSVKYI
jgi:hypothetical protein